MCAEAGRKTTIGNRESEERTGEGDKGVRMFSQIGIGTLAFKINTNE